MDTGRVEFAYGRIAETLLYVHIFKHVNSLGRKTIIVHFFFSESNRTPECTIKTTVIHCILKQLIFRLFENTLKKFNVIGLRISDTVHLLRSQIIIETAYAERHAVDGLPKSNN